MTEERDLPRQRRRKKRKPTPRINWKRFIPVMLVLILLVIGVGWGVVAGIQYIYGAVTGQQVEAKERPSVETVPVKQESVDKPIYILVIGRDESNPAQTDAIYLMSVNEAQKTMDIIGIPSNTSIDDRDQKSSSTINTMYEEGGLDLIKATVADIFHIVIPYYVIVDKESFFKASSVMGPQDLYVESNMQHVDATTGQTDINLRRGYQTLDSAQAYGYLRYVDSDDVGRVQRQERFLKLWTQEVQQSWSITNAWRIWRMWSHMETNISTKDAMHLISAITGMGDNIHYYILPGVENKDNGSTVWVYNPTEASNLLGIMTGNISSDTAQQNGVETKTKSDTDTTKKDDKGAI